MPRDWNIEANGWPHDSERRRSWTGASSRWIARAFGILVALTLHAMFRRVQITGGSMAPTLANGQRLLIARRAYKSREPERHDIIVLRHPDAHRRLVVKRVVGLPGDVVAIRRKRVTINGRRLDEPFVREPVRYRYGPVTVPAGTYIVLGDNRNYSHDSHRWGPVDASLIVGKVLVSYWPPGRISHSTPPSS